MQRASMAENLEATICSSANFLRKGWAGLTPQKLAHVFNSFKAENPLEQVMSAWSDIVPTGKEPRGLLERRRKCGPGPRQPYAD